MTNIPHIRAPIVEPSTGRATHTFYQLLNGLNTDLNDSVSNSTEFEQSHTNSDISEIRAELNKLCYAVDDLRISLDALGGRPEAARRLKHVTVRSGYVAANDQFLNVYNGSVVYFPSVPKEGCELAIRIADNSKVPIKGNGHSINGNLDGVLAGIGTTIRFVYFSSEDGWFAT